ncbi:MAG: L17 family ribosomal protein, partial [Candidatus Peribacteraceae bacterium]|nr:L17 family ribosomal protein [Candidatus Peribacteraceae bacterium]
MRHRHAPRRLPAKQGHARMLQRNLLTSLLLYEQIRTTKKRALVTAPLVDRLVALAKVKKPHIAIRAINRVVTDANASRKIMEVLVKRYSGRASGLTRMVPV